MPEQINRRALRASMGSRTVRRQNTKAKFNRKRSVASRMKELIANQS